jgi:adenylosuccinate synthase
MKKNRKNTFAFCGGAFGDEGKGRVVDEYVNNILSKGPVVVYRDNGGANAGHNVELPDGRRIALHQIPSGFFCPRATVVLGKEMVIHPGDLVFEIGTAIQLAGKDYHAKIMIDEMALLSLDTHRAFESALKLWHEGGRAATGRGISPAYMDVLLRQPLRMRDLKEWNESQLIKHYRLYEALIAGLGVKLSDTLVNSLASDIQIPVGTLKEFLDGLKAQTEYLQPFIDDVNSFIRRTWLNQKYSYVFEKAQAIGLDYRWGVYPDISASETTFMGIFSATEGIVDPKQIPVRAAVIKATYMSSVGTRILPTMMAENLAKRIREDAHEYGATTKRPRDITYLDLPALKFFGKVGWVNSYVLTHMDIVYPNIPIKVCVGYTINGKKVNYRPDQKYLLKVKPVYQELETWDALKVQNAKCYDDLPKQAKKFLKFIAKKLEAAIIMITNGPKRDQSIKIPNFKFRS